MSKRANRRSRPTVKRHGYIPKNSTGPKDFPKGTLPPPPKSGDKPSSSPKND